ncbi:MAG TPA: stalk domain-containing protein [Candidatus Paceibacterota bacterium]|mgnify:FL=1|nr:stalk domain-containing protein [Candidatus Paceibacterota bacterium]
MKKLVLLSIVVMILMSFMGLNKVSANSGLPQEIDFGLETDKIELILTPNETVDWLISYYPDELRISPIGGHISAGGIQVISVMFKRNELNPGFYHSKIDFQINNQTTTVLWKGIVKPSPYPSFIPDNLNFGADSSLELMIRNVGGKPVMPLTWSIVSIPQWLTASATNGQVLDAEGITLTLTVNRLNLVAGLNTGKIVFSTNCQEVPIKEVNCSAIGTETPKPKFEVYPLVLNFGTSLNELYLNIKNSGSGYLSGTINISPDCQFKESIYLSHQIFGPLANSQLLSVIVRVNRTNLSAGDYRTGLVIQSNGGNAYVSLSFTVLQPPQPKLMISPQFLDFSITNSLFFTVTNTGERNSILKWKMNYLPYGFQITPNSGEVFANQSQIVYITVNKPLLQPGEYSCDLLIESNGGNQYLHCYFKIIAPPKIKVSPLVLSFGSQIEELSFLVENVLTSLWQKDLSIKFISTPNWLTISSFNLLLKPGEKTEIKARILSNNLDDLGEGSYKDEIKIESNDPRSPIVKISCSVTVLKPNLSVTPLEIDFKTDLNEKMITVKNTGQAILSGSLKSVDRWLLVSPTTFSLRRGEFISVKVSVNRVFFTDPGGYKGNIVITSNAGTTMINCFLEIPEPKPKLYVEIQEFDFGTNDKVQFVISNTGEKGSQLKWRVKEISPELTISEKEGLLKSGEYKLLTLCLNRFLLTAGWQGKIIFVSETEEKKVTFKARLVPPILLVYPLNLDFSSSLEQVIKIQNLGEELLRVKIEYPDWLESKTTVEVERGKIEEIKVKANIKKVDYGETRDEIKIFSNADNYASPTRIQVKIKRSITLQFVIGRDYYICDGVMKFMDVPPVLLRGRTFLPLRYIAEALEVEINWDDGVVTLEKGNRRIVLKVGTSMALVNNEVVYLDAPPYLFNGRIMVPLRFIAEQFGFGVDWNNSTQTVTLRK